MACSIKEMPLVVTVMKIVALAKECLAIAHRARPTPISRSWITELAILTVLMVMELNKGSARHAYHRVRPAETIHKFVRPVMVLKTVS